MLKNPKIQDYFYSIILANFGEIVKNSQEIRKEESPTKSAEEE